MNSSTSNSDATAPGSETLSKATPRKLFLVIWLISFGGMALAMGGVRLYTEANNVSGATVLGRVVQALDALPQITQEPDDLVMAFGSSMTRAGFSARQFDRQLAEQGVPVKSFNFGFGGLNPYFQDYVARRIREAFEAEDRRLKLAIIELCPFQVTEARWNGAQEAIDSYFTILANQDELWQVVREDPARGIRLLNIHYLRDDISAEMVTWYFGQPLRGGRPRSGLPVDEEAAERRREVGETLSERFEQDYPDFPDDVDWHYPWQGAGTIPEERSAETRDLLAELYALGRTEQRMSDDRLHRINCCDIEELHFEETLIAAFVRMVKQFQMFSDQVEIVMLPRNEAWINYPPEGRQRLNALIERLEQETGLIVHDHQQLDVITPEMFSDTTHLTRYGGDVAYTQFLVETYGPMLAPVDP